MAEYYKATNLGIFGIIGFFSRLNSDPKSLGFNLVVVYFIDARTELKPPNNFSEPIQRKCLIFCLMRLTWSEGLRADVYESLA
jgi:hypothetical protein